MAEKSKKNIAKKGSLIIASEQDITVPWYLQGRNIVLIAGAIILLVLVIRWIGIKERDKSHLVPQTAKLIQPKPESAISGGVKSAAEGLPARTESSPPRIVKLKLLPASPRKGDELVVQAIADGNVKAPVDFIYQWSVNGDIITSERGPTLKDVFVKGDMVLVKITPEAGGVRGIPLTQTVIIGNSYPVVKSECADVKVKGNSYGCRIQAEDPDRDSLVYALLKGPKNMTIDRNTGVITGEYQQADAGTHTLSVSVKDSDNAEVILDVPIQLGFGK